jgi:hypothetical protein
MAARPDHWTARVDSWAARVDSWAASGPADAPPASRHWAASASLQGQADPHRDRDGFVAKLSPRHPMTLNPAAVST